MSFQNESQTTASSHLRGPVWIICNQRLTRRLQFLHSHRARYSISKGVLFPHLKLELSAQGTRWSQRKEDLALSDLQSWPRALEIEWIPVLLNHTLSTNFDLGTSFFVNTPTKSLVSIGSRSHRSWRKMGQNPIETISPSKMMLCLRFGVPGIPHPPHDLSSLVSCNVVRNLWGSHKPRTP